MVLVSKAVRSFDNGKYVMIGPPDRNTQTNQNQTIIDLITSEIVAVLPVPPKNRYDCKEITDNFSKATVRTMTDGTVLTISYVNKRYIISSFRGISINNVGYNGITYQTAVEEVLSKYNFNLNELDTNVSLTIIITHPKLHPFATNCSAVFVQAIDKKKYSNDSSDTKNFMVPNKTNIPNQTEIKITYEQMITNCNRAYINYVNEKKENFGYIVSYNNNVSYAIESSLFKKIRMVFYGKRIDMAGYYDGNYKFLKAINEYSYNIPQLLPHKSKTYNIINTTIDSLAICLVKKIKTECKYTQNIINRFGSFTYYNNYFEKEQINRARSFIKNIVNINDLYHIIDWSDF